MEKERDSSPEELEANRYADLVRRVRAGEADAEEELYRLFAGGVRLLLRRAIGAPRADGEVRPLLTMITEIIRAGTVREPGRLPRLVRTVVRERIRDMLSSPAGTQPAGPVSEVRAPVQSPDQQLAKAILGTALPRDREILTRFYARQQSVEQICRDLHVTADDVEIVKATARARRAEWQRGSSRAPKGVPAPARVVLRVLQVEDSASDAALIARLLEKAGYMLYATRVESAEGMRQALAEQDWDVVIADHQLPDLDAPAALRMLQETGRDIPFIVVSGTIGHEAAVTMMKSGAHDYLLKENLARLAPAVERELKEAKTRRERQEALRALRENEERLALAVTAAQLGAFDFYPAAGKLVLSECAKRQLGLAADATADYDTFLLSLHPNDRERVDRLIQQVLKPESGGQYAAEYRTVGVADGKERWLASCGRVFFGDSSLPQRLIGVTLDDTERRRLLEDLRQLEKLESIGRVAGGLAHDFNNLLTVIGGEAQVAADTLAPGSPLRETMHRILHAVMRAGELTQQLLTFSRRHLHAPRPILLNDFVRESEPMLRRLIGEVPELVLSLDAQAGMLRADPLQLKQVLRNLAVNARDAMPRGGRLAISTSRCPVDQPLAVRRGVSSGNYVALSVSDTGKGMSPDEQARVFEPFFTTKEAGHGAGLGLATVYGIIKQSAGAIWVESQPGRGTTFTMLFPALDPEGRPGPPLSVDFEPPEPVPVLKK
jgi:signal transduction histidine kinase